MSVWTREERQQFWTAIASGTGRFAYASLRDRLKASELLAKSEADFDKRQLFRLEDAIMASHRPRIEVTVERWPPTQMRLLPPEDAV